MPAKQESCCFTGHRPAKLPWRYDESDPRCLRLKDRIVALPYVLIYVGKLKEHGR